MKADETKNQELSKRLQRQVRDLEEELTDVRRKESEAIQRKNDLVGCNFLYIRYVFLMFAYEIYRQWQWIFVFFDFLSGMHRMSPEVVILSKQ